MKRKWENWFDVVDQINFGGILIQTINVMVHTKYDDL